MILGNDEEKIIISTDKSLLNLAYIHNFLANSYWSPVIPLQIVEKGIEGSLCFGVYKSEKQIGFARVITDRATFAYLADVFIDKGERRKGYSKKLMEFILSHDSLQGLRRFLLATKDAHKLYTQFGFNPLINPERWMQIHNPEVYKNK